MPFPPVKSKAATSGQKRKVIAEATSTFNNLCSPSKRVSVVSKVISTFSPKSKRQILDEVAPSVVDEEDEVTVETFTQLSKKGDKLSNAARKLMVKGMRKGTKER